MKSVFRGGILTGVLIAAALLQANAVPLAPGGFVPAAPEPDPTGGSPAAPALSVPFANSVFSGTLVSSVITGDPSNPFGGLTFTYQFNLDSTSIHSASGISMASFGSFLTDVSFNSQAGTIAPQIIGVLGPAPSFVSRSSEGGAEGDVVRFTWLGATVGPGQMSPLLVVQTSAINFQYGNGGIIDGETVNAMVYAPAAVPEPGTVALLLGGFGVLGLFLRRK